mmetsp:Transcript_16007/g.33841  ORF Transcript_16007/g.33841 Transcript_16007/m.33841 type:complete len:596 (+) Transcript_16007:147-1934(+)
MANSGTRQAAGSSSHISALDANQSHRGRGSYYADDDSVVSSNVSEIGGPGDIGSSSNDDDGNRSGSRDPEVVTLTRAVVTDVENANVNEHPNERQSGILPRSRREWCFVFLAILLILAVALGTGLGLGLSFMNKDSSTSSGKEERTVGVGQSAGSPNTEPTQSPSVGWPTFSPSSTPNDNTSPSATSLSPVMVNNLASAIEYHVIAQEISNIASFPEMSDGGDPTTMSAQEKARDFLVFRDYLPLTVMDEEDDVPNNPNGGGNDDPLAIRNNDLNQQRKPYLTTATSAYRVAQRFATAVLYYATDGDNWETNQLWLEPGVHECNFIGVTCEEIAVPAVTLEEALESPNELPHHDDPEFDSTMEQMIVAIDLPENNIAGSLPQEIMALPYMRRLALWSNAVGGSLPTQLGRLTRLTGLHMDDNMLEGNIPRQIGQMSELTDLYLQFNRGIAGRIPAELGNLAKLERLRLSNMSLRGPVPTTLGKLANLVDLSLQDNRLGRSLPAELGNLTNLESMLLNRNIFTGGIPVSWKSLGKLKRLELQYNELELDMDEWVCPLRKNAPEGSGLLKVMKADCKGDEPRVACSCCTECFSYFVS